MSEDLRQSPLLVGILDSGVGGLSVYLPLRAALPDVDMVYLADAAFAPYGTRSQPVLVDRLSTVGQWLKRHGVQLLVVACNTATVNGAEELRAALPDITIVGMEPAIKPAAEATDRIIVLGTESTVGNPRYRELVARSIGTDGNIPGVQAQADDQHPRGVTVTRAGHKVIWHIGANELVAQVEAGRLTDTTLLEQKLQVPVLEPEAVVIGCSHFSFLKSTIAKRWPELAIFDGADGVVRQTIALLGSDRRVEPRDGRSTFLTTGPDREVRFISPPIHFRHVDIFGDTREVNSRSLRE